MPKRPHCQYCKVPLRKYTVRKPFQQFDHTGMITPPVTKEEARRLTNEEITLYSYSTSPGKEHLIESINTWDGVSYGNSGDNHYCSKDCGYRDALYQRGLPQYRKTRFPTAS